MALFRRKDQPATEIPELKEYYAAQKKDRPIVAWALALISLLITLAVLLLLFFAGRWLYQTIFDNEDKSQTTTTEQTKNDSAVGSTQESQEEVQEGDAGHAHETDDTSEAANQSGHTETETDSEQMSASTELPSTGAADTLVIFAITVMIGYLASTKYLARKNR